MNLTDYPTPETDKLEAHWTSLQGTRVAFRALLASHLQHEREAAAWRDVAKKYRDMKIPNVSGDDADEINAIDEAFDRLLAETNSEPSGQRSASARVEPRTSKNDEHSA